MAEVRYKHYPTSALIDDFFLLSATTTPAATATTAGTTTSEGTTTTEGTTTAATSTPSAGTTASTSAPPTTTTAATAAATTTTTLATVTTSATTAGTTTTVLCPLQDLMGKDGSEPLIPLEQVSVKKDDSAVEYQKYGGDSSPWVVDAPIEGDNAKKPAITFDLTGAAGDESEPQVTSVSMNPGSNVDIVSVTFISKEGETTTFPGLQVTREGKVLFSAPFVLPATEVIIVLEKAVDASIGKYTVSPNVQGCFRAETTTIVTPTTTTAGTTTPSTTTVSTVSTTGTVITTTTPTVTTTLSTTTPPPIVGTTQVTTAVVTTTTTATGTTTVVCPLTGEMPKQTPDFTDEQFTPVTGGGSPREDQPGVVRWTPTYEEPAKNPVLQINLVPVGTTSTPLLQSVTVTEVLATTVTINVYLTEDTTAEPVFTITVTIPDIGSITVYVRPEDNLPIEASVVEIVLGAPKNPDDTTYDTTVTLVGCFEPLAGK